MDEATQTQPTTTRKRRTNPVVLFLVAFIIAAVVGAVMYNIQIRRPLAENRKLNSELVYNVLGLGAEPLKMSERFKDADGDLVPDPPTDPKEFIDPPKLIFSYVATNEPETYRTQFKEF